MARKPKLPAELQKKPKAVMAHNDLEENCCEYLEKVKNFAENTDFTSIRTNKNNYIENTLITTVEYFAERKNHHYTISDYDISKSLELLQSIVLVLSDETRYQPTIFSFCRMLGISLQTFNNWTCENSDRGEASRQVLDYFRSILAQGMMTGEYNPVAASFIGKSTLGMKEQDATQMNINILNSDMSLEDILADYQKNNK